MATTEKKQEKGLEEELEAIRPAGDHRIQTLGVGEEKREYVQKPLSFFGKMTLSKVLGQALNKAMAGGGGTALASLFGTTPEELEARTQGGGGGINFAELQETAMMLQAVGTLMEHAPELLVDVYVIALHVPSGEIGWARETMQKDADDGGLSDEDGFAIMDTFVDQNSEALKSFFVDHLMPMVKKFRGEDTPTPPPSNRTQRRTRKPSKSS